jgi:hypothetical protein
MHQHSKRSNTASLNASASSNASFDPDNACTTDTSISAGIQSTIQQQQTKLYHAIPVKRPGTGQISQQSAANLEYSYMYFYNSKRYVGVNQWLLGPLGEPGILPKCELRICGDAMVWKLRSSTKVWMRSQTNRHDESTIHQVFIGPVTFGLLWVFEGRPKEWHYRLDLSCVTADAGL